MAADVLVVGGGPAGAATATFLACNGIAVTLLDRARFPRPKACAEYLSPQAGRLLDALGILPGVARLSTSLGGMDVRTPHGAHIVGDFAAITAFRPFHPRGLALPRRLFDELLLRRAQAAGVDVREEFRVHDLLYDRNGAVSGVQALGSDGASHAFSARRVRGPDRLAFVAHYHAVAGVGARGEMLVEPGGYLGIAAVGDRLANVSLVLDRSAATRLLASGDHDSVIERWLQAHPHIAARFTAAERVDGPLATGPFASRVRRAWRPGLALVGDAADFFDPFTGEGIYSALLGAEVLAQYAERALRSGAWTPLAEYDRWRRREFSPKWRVEALIAVAVSHPWILERAARAFAARPDLAHLLVGVTGDFVPAREVLRPGYLGRLLLGMFSRPDSFVQQTKTA
jgi:menaquinone-9 beta-reductase